MGLHARLGASRIRLPGRQQLDDAVSERFGMGVGISKRRRQIDEAGAGFRQRTNIAGDNRATRRHRLHHADAGGLGKSVGVGEHSGATQRLGQHRLGDRSVIRDAA